MRKKVLVILGSPRKKGNSAILAGQIAKGAAAQKAEVETVYLHGMDIAPCKACMECRKKDSKSCSIRDDMQKIFPKLVEADAWVIASPVYWFTMSAQLKIFMDRCFALAGAGNQAFQGKKIAIAMSFGDRDPFDSGCVNALRTFQDAYRYAGATIVGMVYGSAMAAGDIRADRALLKEAKALGRTLAGSTD